MTLGKNKFLRRKQMKYNYYPRLLFVLLFCSIHSVVFSQQVKVIASLDTNAVKIGDPVNLEFEIQHSIGTTVKWPSIPDTISKIEILKRNSIDTLKGANDLITEKQVIKLICFDSGSYTIPSFAFFYKTGKDTSIKVINTDSLLLVIKNIPIDTAKAIKDIKPPLEVPFSWKEVMPYIIGGLIVVAIIALIYYFIKRRKKKAMVNVAQIIKRPAHEVALEALQKLENEKVWQQGNNKYFHSELSDITRTYIENRFGINAMEHTTDEIINGLKTFLTSESKEKIKQVLVLSDLVKFAKAQPISIENELSLHNAYDFVNMTKQIGEVKEEKEGTKL
ncbi:MAG TPA: transmembrane domain-containing protein [Cytophagaceae bacterium]|jgi:hypothetical protein|nr:transmembrane domain-containing protein [Cytophagaceae bacterium]